jgi:hypothetical protein
VQFEDTVFVVCLDGFGIHGVGQSEAATEGAVGTLDAQIIMFVFFLLEFALAANGKDVVFDTDVEVFGPNIGEIGFDNEFLAIFKDVDGRSPSGDAGLIGRGIEGFMKKAANLVLKGGGTAERFKTIEGTRS